MPSTPNEISAVLTDADVTEVFTSITAIKNKLPFLISKSADERQAGFKLGDHTIGFLTKARNYAQLHADWIPSEIDAGEWGNDTDLAAKLLKIRNELRSLLGDIDDTLGEAGIEALSPATKFYKNVHLKADNGVPNAKTAYDDMQQQFPGRKPAKPKTNP